MVLLQGLCYVVDITMVFLTFIGIFDFVFHLVELSRVDERGLHWLLPYRTVPGIYCWRFHVAGFMLFYLRIIFKAIYSEIISGLYTSQAIPFKAGYLQVDYSHSNDQHGCFQRYRSSKSYVPVVPVFIRFRSTKIIELTILCIRSNYIFQYYR